MAFSILTSLTVLGFDPSPAPSDAAVDWVLSDNYIGSGRSGLH